MHEAHQVYRVWSSGSLFIWMHHASVFFSVFFNKNPPQSRDLSDSCLRDGASKSHQRVHKSRIQIAAAAVVKPLCFFILMENSKKNKKELRINQSSYPSDTHCVVLQHSIMRITFTISPLWFCWCAWFIYDVSHLQFILLLFPLTLYGFCTDVRIYAAIGCV